MDWDSDLFYIHNGKDVALGNISGKYHDGKWGFIAAYWTKNYKRFI